MTSPGAGRRLVVIDGRFDSDRYPGVARYLEGLTWALAERSADERLLLLTAGDGASSSRAAPGQDPDAARPGLPRLSSTLEPRSWREQFGLRRLALQRGWALFHTPFWWTSLWLPCPLVVTLYDVIPALDPSFLPGVRSRFLYRIMLPRVVRRARGLITLTAAARDEICDHLGIPPRRVRVIPAAPHPRFRPADAEEVAAVRRRLSLPPRYVLFVGAPRPHKNLVRLLEAWELVAKKVSGGYGLVLAGPPDPRFRDAGDHAAGRGTAATFLGAVAEQDLPALYSGAEALVLPSLAEGFGFPLVEALACGAPVACSRLPALEEVAGRAACYFDPTDPRAMAGALEDVLFDLDLRAELRRHAERRVAELSWRRAASETLALYRELV